MELMCHDQTLLCPFPSDFSYPHPSLALPTPCSLFKPTVYTEHCQCIHRAIGWNMDSVSGLGSLKKMKNGQFSSPDKQPLFSFSFELPKPQLSLMKPQLSIYHY